MTPVALASEAPPDPFEQLSTVVREERAALLAVAVREGLSAEEGLECVQDALCAWLIQSQREPPGPSELLAASLKHRVRNVARNARRRHHRLKPHRSLDPSHEPIAASADAEQLLGVAESSLRLKVCFAELRDVERAVITLRLLEERSGEDVALALGLSRAHVDVLVHRAKATLRVCMLAPECAGG
jgi:RNA polymerase sigma-70 factor, ECF subfamily